MDAPRGEGRIARLYLGALLAAMATGQLLSFPTFVDAIESYRVGGGALAIVIAVALVAFEAAGAAGLLAPGRLRLPVTAGATLGLAAAAVWTLLAVQALARGLSVDNCGCFGAYLSQPLRWWVLPQDAAFVALAGWVLYQARCPVRSPRAGRHKPAPSA